MQQLETIDNHLYQSQFDQALKELLKLEKKAYSPFQCIAIAKRYIKMNYLDNARKFLNQSARKHSNDENVLAVYVWTLLQCGDIDAAMQYSRKLENTPFSGLYAEARFRNLPADSDTSGVFPDLQKEFVFAYNATKNTVYLQNAAVYESYYGNFEKAYTYHPIHISPYDNAEFWALISYDSGNYLQAINDAQVIPEKDRLRTYVISADCYLRMHEVKLAQQMWAKAYELSPEADPNVLMNCSFGSIEEGQPEMALVYMKKLVNSFPDYFPALVLYSKFALNDSKADYENSLEKELRKRGLKSIDMIAKDSREKIPISDAVYRFEESFKRTQNPKIQVELVKLKWAQEEGISKEQMVVDVWNLLERYYLNEEVKNNEVLDFAIQFFVLQEKYDEANGLLQMSSVHGPDGTINPDELTYNQCRFYASIYNNRHDYDMTERLLEECLNKGTKINDDVYINLANYAEANGNSRKAVEYYSTVIGRTLDVYTKSELNYRIARINFQEGNYKKAKLFLDYCLALNQGHTEARLLLKKVLLEL